MIHYSSNGWLAGSALVVDYSTIQYSTVQCSTVRYRCTRQDTVYFTVMCGAERDIYMRYEIWGLCWMYQGGREGGNVPKIRDERMVLYPILQTASPHLT